MPCTVLINEGSAYVWIPVPLIPHKARAMDMYQLEHLPVLHGDLQFQFDLYNRILATTPDWSRHAEMSAAELHACHKVAHDFFCPRSHFLSQRLSCSFALLHGNKGKATQLCPTTIARRPTFTVAVKNESQDFRIQGKLRQIAVLRISKPTNFTLDCPSGKEYRFYNESVNTSIPPGCLISTNEEAVFLTRQPHDVHVYEKKGVWKVLDLLSNDTLTRVKGSSFQERLSKSPIPLPVFTPLKPPPHTSWLFVVAVTMGSIFALVVLADLVARYFALFRQVYQELMEAAQQPDSPLPKPTPVEDSATHYVAAAPIDELPSVLALARRCKRRPRPQSLAL
jgi:hypothetical protein